MFRVRNSRRRDYTKREKESFELWIASNPKPTHEQKTEFARQHSLTDSQLQNFINNRKRKMKAIEKMNEVSAAMEQILPSHSMLPPGFLYQTMRLNRNRRTRA
jgi:Homeobox KN domain